MTDRLPRPMDAQEEHNETFSVDWDRMPGKEAFSAMLDARARVQSTAGSGSGVSDAGQSVGFDPIADAMARHPGLTLEKALEMAEAFGF